MAAADCPITGMGGRPASVRAPKVRKVPPPAIAFTALERKPDAKSSKIMAPVIRCSSR